MQFTVNLVNQHKNKLIFYFANMSIVCKSPVEIDTNLVTFLSDEDAYNSGSVTQTMKLLETAKKVMSINNNR